MPRSSRPRRSHVADTADYTDAFELRWSGPDHHTPEQWARAGLEEAPRAILAVIVVAQRLVLGFRLGPPGSPDHVLGWPVTHSTSEEIELRAGSWLLDGVISAERTGPTTARLTTSLHFRRRLGRALWVLVGPAHRRVAPLLLARAGERMGVRDAERPRAVPVVSRRS